MDEEQAKRDGWKVITKVGDRALVARKRTEPIPEYAALGESLRELGRVVLATWPFSLLDRFLSIRPAHRPDDTDDPSTP